jgi:hypothetical protein
MRLGNMLPTSAGNNPPYSIAAHVVRLGKLLASGSGNVQLANMSHAILCQLGTWIRRAIKRREAIRGACIHGVLMVVDISSSVKVFWIAARRVIATVTDDFAFWNRTVGKFIDHAMSANARSSVDVQTSIAPLGALALPFPALIGATLGHFLPESLTNRQEMSLAVMASEVSRRLAPYVSKSDIISFGQMRAEPATTVAVAIGNCVRGVVRGTMFHVENLLQRFSAMHPGAHNVAGALPCLHYRPNGGNRKLSGVTGVSIGGVA